MYFLDNGTELTNDMIVKYIQKFRGTELPELKVYKEYYDGKQNILNKYVSDSTKPCNKLVVNYCYDVVESYSGYISGIPIAYSSAEDITDLLEILRYNDYHTEDNELLHNTLIYGVGYELMYLDEEAQQRFRVVSSEEVIPIYSNDLNQDLVAAIRVYSANDINNQYKCYVDVYTDKAIKHYKSEQSFTTLELLDEEQHYYGQVPVNVFTLNSDRTPIFKQIMSLQDAYNKLISADVDDFEAFVDAYMCFKGLTADEDDLAKMKETRTILLDDDSDAFFLTKNKTESGNVESLLENIKSKIEKIAKCPDFNDEKFMSQSGIAIKFKMIGMENVSSSIEANMRKVLLRRLELMCAIQSLTADDFTWRDINIIFTRNLPVNEVELAQYINSLRGLVSDKTLLSQLPFIGDVDAELERIAEEKGAAASLYNFGLNEEE